MTPSTFQWTPELFDICVVDPAHISSDPPYRSAHQQAQHRFNYYGYGDATIDLNTPPAPQRPPPEIPSILYYFRTTQESTDAGIESIPLVDISSPKTVSSETTAVVEKARKLDESVCRPFSVFESTNIQDRSLRLPAGIGSTGTGRIGGFGRFSMPSSPLAAYLPWQSSYWSTTEDRCQTGLCLFASRPSSHCSQHL